MTQALLTERRRLGRYYTPDAIVHGMLRLCGLATDAELPPPVPQRSRILDPACGEGAFLLPLVDRLAAECDAGAGEPLWRLVGERLFGVDADSQAIQRLRERLRERVAVPAADTDAWERILGENFRAGDSLTGPGFEVRERRSLDREHGACSERPTAAHAEANLCDAPPLDWRQAFPHVAAAGGFDLVVGNPPYLREKDAKPVFDRIAHTPLGRRWRQARMDLWHYFVHRGLDLLRPGGELCFIVNSYWLASSGASKLIDRLQREATLLEVLLLGDRAVFAGVAGRHLIVRLAHGRQPAPCRIQVGLACEPPDPAAAAECYEIAQTDLYHNGRICLERPAPRWPAGSNLQPLAARFLVRQGIAENPPRISARMNERSDNRYTIGEGVFVLDREELAGLALTPAEQAVLRPYYQACQLGHYRIPPEPTHFLCYLTRHTAPAIAELPRLESHLSRFRPLLEERREVRLGKCDWWHLHWPREERLFVEPRVLSVQMGRRPQFVAVYRPAFVGFSVNVITPQPGTTGDPAWLTAVLNSSPAADWFARHAKRRGANLEINIHLLNEFPLPPRDAEREAALCDLVRQRQAAESAEPAAVTLDDLEARIERSVNDWYG